jgi:hypothetical protein
MYVKCVSDREKKAYDICSSDALLQKIAGSRLGSTFQLGYPQKRAVKRIKTMIGLPFGMDIIIIICWSIWSERFLDF